MSSLPNAAPNVLSASGAITPGGGYFAITKAGVAALTLALPTIDGQRMLIQDVGGHAHTITAPIASPPTAGFNGTLSLITFNGTIGSWVELIGYNGSWYARSSGVTIA